MLVTAKYQSVVLESVTDVVWKMVGGVEFAAHFNKEALSCNMVHYCAKQKQIHEVWN
jgi:hypothetical protein